MKVKVIPESIDELGVYGSIEVKYNPKDIIELEKATLFVVDVITLLQLDYKDYKFKFFLENDCSSGDFFADWERAPNGFEKLYIKEIKDAQKPTNIELCVER